MAGYILGLGPLAELIRVVWRDVDDVAKLKHAMNIHVGGMSTLKALVAAIIYYLLKDTDEGDHEELKGDGQPEDSHFEARFLCPHSACPAVFASPCACVCPFPVLSAPLLRPSAALLCLPLYGSRALLCLPLYGCRVFKVALLSSNPSFPLSRSHWNFGTLVLMCTASLHGSVTTVCHMVAGCVRCASTCVGGKRWGDAASQQPDLQHTLTMRRVRCVASHFEIFQTSAG